MSRLFNVAVAVLSALTLLQSAASAYTLTVTNKSPYNLVLRGRWATFVPDAAFEQTIRMNETVEITDPMTKLASPPGFPRQEAGTCVDIGSFTVQILERRDLGPWRIYFRPGKTMNPCSNMGFGIFHDDHGAYFDYF